MIPVAHLLKRFELRVAQFVVYRGSCCRPLNEMTLRWFSNTGYDQPLSSSPMTSTKVFPVMFLTMCRASSRSRAHQDPIISYLGPAWAHLFCWIDRETVIELTVLSTSCLSSTLSTAQQLEHYYYETLCSGIPVACFTQRNILISSGTKSWDKINFRL